MLVRTYHTKQAILILCIRNTTNNDNRIHFVMQNHYFTYQRQGNNELHIQALSTIVADL